MEQRGNPACCLHGEGCGGIPESTKAPPELVGACCMGAGERAPRCLRHMPGMQVPIIAEQSCNKPKTKG